MKIHFKKWMFVFFSISSKMYSQQSLFNVPSSEITEKKKIFFQQQVNIKNSLLSNTNLCYGIGHNMEVGINLIGLQTDFGRLYNNESIAGGSISPQTMLTFQKSFSISKHSYLVIGSEVGTNIFKSSTSDLSFQILHPSIRIVV